MMYLSKRVCYIPDRFEREIVLHAARILKLSLPDAPAILAISGPPGYGKTMQCETILKRLGIRVFSLSASDFESKDAGEPAKQVEEKYQAARDYMAISSGNLAAILIDDADVAFGNWGSMVQYTVNTQQIIGVLMRIANRPTDPDAIRVPIFLTGNDFSKLYAPLRRDGRMDCFYWKPDPTEKVTMVYHTLPYLTFDECQKLVTYVDRLMRWNNLPPSNIAFYTALSAHIHDQQIWQEYRQHRDYNALCNPLDAVCLPAEPDVSLEELKDAAHRFIMERKQSLRDLSTSGTHH